MNVKIHGFLICVKTIHTSYYKIWVTVPSANSLLSEYINPTGKKLCQKQFLRKNSVRIVTIVK